MTATTYLRFPDEATARSVLADYLAPDEAGNLHWITATHEYALDPVGTLYTAGTYDAQGNVLTAPVAQAGWHVNLRGDVPTGAAAYAIVPLSPSRVFAA